MLPDTTHCTPVCHHWLAKNGEPFAVGDTVRVPIFGRGRRTELAVVERSERAFCGWCLGPVPLWRLDDGSLLGGGTPRRVVARATA